MYNDYHITMDSFGADCPANWSEIADHLNGIIDNMEGIVDDFNELTPDGREQIDRLWEQYCAGELLDAPKPIMD